MNGVLLSLQITALGMGLVFGSIVLLWGMMLLLTRATAEKPAPSAPGPAAPSPASPDLRPQAAALAVALALAEQEHASAHPLSTPPAALVSAWQLGMRTRQLSEKGNFHKHKAT